jgi:hypothetical protein
MPITEKKTKIQLEKTLQRTVQYSQPTFHHSYNKYCVPALYVMLSMETDFEKIC